MRLSTARRSAGKVSKPRPDFPLFPHATGRWAKKIRQRFHYFGSTATDPDGDAALEEWLRVKDDLLAGRKPRPKDAQGLTIGKLCNLFSVTLEARIDGGRLVARSKRDYRAVTDRLVGFFGPGRSVEDIRPEDFELLLSKLPKTWGQSSRGLFIAMARSVFNYAYNRDQQLIGRPVSFGMAFKTPGKKERRKIRAARAARDFTPKEVQQLIDTADPVFKAALLLGINAAFGNTDIARVPWTAIDGDWVTFPRPKTGEPRRAWLWPETRAALADVKAAGRKPVDPADAGLVFLTPRGLQWVYLAPSGAWVDTVCNTMRDTRKRTGLSRGSFYDLRRTFRTVADEALDTAAIDLVMGHADPSMGAVYRQRIDDARVKRVCEHVRGWLFPKKAKKIQ
jgi:integrase